MKTARYVKKNVTGAIWVSQVRDVWKKVTYGNKFQNTKPIGYVTTQFNPDSPRNLRRFSPINDMCDLND